VSLYIFKEWRLSVVGKEQQNKLGDIQCKIIYAMTGMYIFTCLFLRNGFDVLLSNENYKRFLGHECCIVWDGVDIKWLNHMKYFYTKKTLKSLC